MAEIDVNYVEKSYENRHYLLWSLTNYAKHVMKLKKIKQKLAKTVEFILTVLDGIFKFAG